MVSTLQIPYPNYLIQPTHNSRLALVSTMSALMHSNPSSSRKNTNTSFTSSTTPTPKLSSTRRPMIRTTTPSLPISRKRAHDGPCTISPLRRRERGRGIRSLFTLGAFTFYMCPPCSYGVPDGLDDAIARRSVVVRVVSRATLICPTGCSRGGRVCSECVQ